METSALPALLRFVVPATSALAGDAHGAVGICEAVTLAARAASGDRRPDQAAGVVETRGELDRVDRHPLRPLEVAL